jgi:hypothetical protein
MVLGEFSGQRWRLVARAIVDEQQLVRRTVLPIHRVQELP